jgi:hypothetical protein
LHPFLLFLSSFFLSLFSDSYHDVTSHHSPLLSPTPACSCGV